MPVAQLTLELRIEHAQSLKDRRQVVRSMKDQLRQGFNISVAELDEAVTWQSATLGVVAISRSRDYLHGLMEEVERAARRMTNELGAELTDSFWSTSRAEAELPISRSHPTAPLPPTFVCALSLRPRKSAESLCVSSHRCRKPS